MDVEHTQSNGHLVDINNAPGDVISSVNGIGPVLAQRIVEYRETNGPFEAVDQLSDVEGIGASLLERIADHLTVGSEETPAPATTAPEESLEAPEDTEADVIDEPVQEIEQPVADAQESQEQVSEQENQEPTVDEPAAEHPVAEEPVTEEPVDVEAVVEEPVIEEPVDVEAVVEEPGGAEPVIDKLEDEPEDSPEEMASVAADELAQEIAESEPEISEMGLYTRATAEDGLSEWAPPPAAKLDEEEEAALDEPVEPDWLADEDDQEPMAVAEEPEFGVADEFVQVPDDESEPIVIEEPVAALVVQPTEPVAAAVSAPPATEPTPEKQGVGFWRSLLLVLLGGLLGVLLTLAIAIIWTGTLDFASRAQVDALSRNVGTMQANQELAWQRIDELSITSQQLAGKVAELEQLRGTVQEMQGSLAQAEQELAATQASIGELGEDVDQLRTSMDQAIGELDERVSTNAESVATLDESMTALEESFEVVEERVGLFDGFFTSLRDLLIDMQGAPEATEAETPDTSPAQEQPATETQTQ